MYISYHTVSFIEGAMTWLISLEVFLVDFLEDHQADHPEDRHHLDPVEWAIPPPPPQLISRFQTFSQNPAQAQRMLQPQGGLTTFAAGCDGRWTIVLLRNGQLFLMYVFSSSVFGNTTGIIWPNFTFASFPSSAIAAYSCY